MKLYRSILLTILSEDNLSIIVSKCNWNEKIKDYECPPFKIVDSNTIYFPSVRNKSSIIF